MDMNVTGMNAGVIQNKDEFLALALKLKHKNSDDRLLFFPIFVLRDLFIALESHLHEQGKLNGIQRENFIKAQAAVTKEMHTHIPTLEKVELEKAKTDCRVEAIHHFMYKEEKLFFTLKFPNDAQAILEFHELQVELLTNILIQAINNSGMRELALRLSSLLDYLPLYDVECQPDGTMVYDTYTQPAWKHELFDHYLALLYHYDEAEQPTYVGGTVIKTRSLPDTPETQAIAKRLLAFSPRLEKIANKPCQVHIQAINVGKDESIHPDKYMRTLHRMRQQVMKITSEKSVRE